MKTLKITLLVLLLSVLSGLKAQIVIPGGNIIVSYPAHTLPAGHYVVNPGVNVFVPAGAAFTIEPGVIIDFRNNSLFFTQPGSKLIIMDSTEFRMQSRSMFDIKGDFFVYGAPGREAFFHDAPSLFGTGWYGINFLNCVTDTVFIDYAKIIGAYKHGFTSIHTQAGAVCVDKSNFDIFEIHNTFFKGNDVKIDGGALFFNLSSCNTHLLIADNIFEENTADNHGGAALFNTFLKNSALNGGAVYVFDGSGSVMGFDINEFAENEAIDNGGACFFMGKVVEVVLSRNKFYKNYTANFDGGAIYSAALNHYNPLTIMLNTFEGNAARLGGAVCTANDNGVDKNYFNNLFYNNQSTTEGGAVFCERNYNFFNNTFNGNNTLGGTAGAIYAQTNLPGAYGISNNILWADPPAEVNGVLSVGNTYPHFYYCDIDDPALAGAGGAGCINLDPLFVNPGINDFRLQSASPCIDAGDPAFITGAYYPYWTTDLDFTARVKGSYVDMGAYELFVKKSAAQLKSSETELSSIETSAKIYPNPAIDNVNVRLEGDVDNNVAIAIYDLTGKKILKTVKNIMFEQDKEISLNVSQIPDGVYIMEVETGNTHFTKRLIIR